MLRVPMYRARRGVVALLVAAVVVVAVSAAFVVLGTRHVAHASAVGDERSRVAAVAGQLAVDFTSVDYRTLKTDFAAAAAHATPAFAKKYLATVKAFAALYRKGKVVQTTSAEVEGVSALTPTTATVLVALKGTATNAATKGATQQLFRMQVDLARQGGRWLASNVQPL